MWSKAGKGGVAVRKLLVWQSGKQEAWPGWPAWVVHFTDYSPDRKTPLDRTIRTALSESEALAIADGLSAENIKKGWEEVAAMQPEGPPHRPRKGSSSKSAQPAADSPKKASTPKAET